MALSKARQAQQGWAEISLGERVKYRSGQPSWLKRQAAETPHKSRRPDEDETELVQPESTSADINIRLTVHAKCRLAQRNLSPEEVGFVLLYGQSWHKAGAIITHLRRKDIPGRVQADPRWHQLIGVTVVTPTRSERTILTAYRNRHSGLQKIKHKPDYGWSSP